MTLTKEFIDSTNAEQLDQEELKKFYALIEHTDMVESNTLIAAMLIAYSVYEPLESLRKTFMVGVWHGFKLGKKLAEVEQLERL